MGEGLVSARDQCPHGMRVRSGLEDVTLALVIILQGKPAGAEILYGKLRFLEVPIRDRNPVWESVPCAFGSWTVDPFLNPVLWMKYALGSTLLDRSMRMIAAIRQRAGPFERLSTLPRQGALKRRDSQVDSRSDGQSNPAIASGALNWTAA